MPLHLLLLLSLLYANPSTAQSEFIMGKVYNQVNKSTLSNAKLILQKNNRYYSKTKTDHVGNYWFGNLQPGSYSIWVLQDGFVQLEMGGIELKKNGSIQLDLGMMETAENTNVNTESKIYLTYHKPIKVHLEEEATAYQDFQSDIRIISEVYDGHEIRIAPQKRPAPIEESNRPTHYYDSLKALEKSATSFPRGI